MVDKGGTLRRDYKETEYREPGEGYTGELPTKGLYPGHLVRAGLHESKAGNEGVEWVFELLPGAENKHGDPCDGWQGFIYTGENSEWKEQQILVALGAIKPNGKINMAFDALLRRYGKKAVTVRIFLEEYLPEDGEKEWKPKIGAVMAAKGAAKATPEDDGPDGDEDAIIAGARATRAAGRKRNAPEPEPEPDEDDEDDEDEEDEIEEGEGDEPYDPDELAEELEELSLIDLKRRGKEEFGLTAGQMRGKKAEDIIDTILDTLPEDSDEDEEDEEDEAEEEPEPPARASRRSTKAAPAKAAPTARNSSRRRSTKNEPPF